MELPLPIKIMLFAVPIIILANLIIVIHGNTRLQGMDARECQLEHREPAAINPFETGSDIQR